MARKPKPTVLKVLAGNPGKRKLNDQEPKPDAVLPEPPSHLDALAREEWGRAAKELEALGLLTRVDMAMFAAYCQAFSRWAKAEEKLAKTGLLAKTSNGNIIQNPLIGVANKAMLLMWKFASEFGLSPVARTRLSINEKDDKPSKWAL